MARGGYRPGAGRPKKSGSAKSAESQDRAIKKELSAPMEASNFTPLDYMLQVMNDPDNGVDIKLRAASLAAPYVHGRKGEGTGKKDEREARAKTAGAGRFASSPPPLRIVK